MGTSGATLIERDEFPGTVFEGGNSSLFSAVPLDSSAAGVNERQQPHMGGQQRAPVQGFPNARKLHAQENAAAREDLWNLRLHRQASDVRRLAVAQEYMLLPSGEELYGNPRKARHLTLTAAAPRKAGFLPAASGALLNLLGCAGVLG